MVFRSRHANQFAHRQNAGYNRNVQEIQNIPQQRKESRPDIADITSRGKVGLSKTLNNVQQVLKVVETTAPLIQQYGPLVKNLPTMLSIMKEFNKSEGEEEPKQMNLDEPAVEVNENEPDSSEIPEESGSGDGESTPKLFI